MKLRHTAPSYTVTALMIILSVLLDGVATSAPAQQDEIQSCVQRNPLGFRVWDLPPSKWQPVTFTSEDGRYVLTNVDDLKNYKHSIYVTDCKNRKKSLLYQYERSGGLLWSPDSQALIINDAGGSDFENALLFHLDPRSGPIDIGKQLLASGRPATERHNILNADHLYFDVIAWITNDTVLLQVSGHGNSVISEPSVSFTYVYVYRLPNSFTLVGSSAEEKH